MIQKIKKWFIEEKNVINVKNISLVIYINAQNVKIIDIIYVQIVLKKI